MTNLDKMKKDLISMVENLEIDELYDLIIDLEENNRCRRSVDNTLALPESLFTCERCVEKHQEKCGDEDNLLCRKYFIEYCQEEFAQDEKRL